MENYITNDNNFENDNTDKVNEEAFNEANDKLNSYGLEWNFRSINYVLNKENISFGQLRSCVYLVNNSPVFDYIKSTLTLIKAGLIGSKQVKESEYKLLENKAYEIIEDWRSNIGFIGTLHILIIKVMEDKHFFMGDHEIKIVSHLNYKNSQVDLIKNMMAEDLEEKIRQAQALNNQS